MKFAAIQSPRTKVVLYSGLPRRSLAKTEVPAPPYLEKQASQRACSCSTFVAKVGPGSSVARSLVVVL